MKKLLAILMCLVILTGCSNSQTENNQSDTDNKKNEIYQEIDKKQEEYDYQSITMTLKDIIKNNEKLNNQKSNLEDVIICGSEIAIFTYKKDDTNIYDILNEKLYSNDEVKEFSINNDCKNKNITRLSDINQKEIDYLKK